MTSPVVSFFLVEKSEDIRDPVEMAIRKLDYKPVQHLRVVFLFYPGNTGDGESHTSTTLSLLAVKTSDLPLPRSPAPWQCGQSMTQATKWQ